MTPPALSSPFDFVRLFWPDVRLYGKQADAIESVRYNDETFVTAGNMLGKDFISGLIALGAFLAPGLFLRPPGGGGGSSEVRVITTSVKDDHLRVLWGEIGRFVQTSRFPLTRDFGGPLTVNHRDVRKFNRAETVREGRIVKEWRECKISYLRGMVSEKGEGMAGHHAANTLLVVDEGSGVDDLVYQQGVTWAKRVLVIGNPNPSTGFFYKFVKQGDVPAAG